MIIIDGERWFEDKSFCTKSPGRLFKDESCWRPLSDDRMSQVMRFLQLENLQNPNERRRRKPDD